METDINTVVIKDKTGFERLFRYNRNGDIEYYKDSTGVAIYKEFDNNHNCIYCNNIYDGIKYWNEYDNKGKLIHTKYSNGYEKTFNYKN